jgi:hypothetical protein
MILRKYTKVFKNRGSARKFQNHMEYIWEKSNLGNEYFPDTKLTFDETARRRRARYTVTYYLGKYARTQKISVDDYYGSSASDAKKKFRNLITENFKNDKLVIKSVRLKTKHGGNLNLYTFRYYLKPKK